MENGSFIGQDYFEHLLAEIREIRLSERRFYQKLTDIYSTTIDYRSKEHMGLTTWENAPDGKIVNPDVSIAKNYLNQLELEDMGRLVNAVLDVDVLPRLPYRLCYFRLFWAQAVMIFTSTSGKIACRRFAVCDRSV